MRVEVASLEQVKLLGGRVPAVVEHNTGEANDPNARLYVVMEHIHGLTLEKYIAENGPLGIEESLTIVNSLIETIRIGHDGGILHRDIKPKNLIVDKETKAVTVLDYGISFNTELGEELTRTNEDFRNEFIVLPETNSHGANHRDMRSDVACIAGILY